MTSPLVSVVIPAYNCGHTIGDTLNSVFQQTYPSWEVIVINDGSSDDTLEVLRTFKDPRFKYFSVANRGVAVSRNRGIDEATGKYIAFLDADDLWTPEKLTAQVGTLQKNPMAAVAYSWTDYIGVDDTFLRCGMRPKFRGNVYRNLLVTNFLECGSNPLVRSSAIRQVGGFDQALAPCEDWDMWLRLAENYEFEVVQQPQILYRVSTNSASFNLQKHEASEIKAVEKVFSRVPVSLAPLKKKHLASFYRYLTFKVLDNAIYAMSPRQRGLLAMRYWLTSIHYRPSLIWQPKVIASTLLRISKLIAHGSRIKKRVRNN